jgi:hypothetical protein
MVNDLYNWNLVTKINKKMRLNLQQGIIFSDRSLSKQVGASAGANACAKPQEPALFPLGQTVAQPLFSLGCKAT